MSGKKQEMARAKVQSRSKGRIGVHKRAPVEIILRM
jgi:hypothetical protein